MPYGTANVDVIQSSVSGTPPVFKDGNGTTTGTLCRAWVNFNGSSAVIRAAFNVTSITRNSTGNYTVNFTNAMPDANYSSVANAGTAGTGGVTFIAPYNFTNTTTTANICCFNTAYSALIDTDVISFSVFR